MTLLDIDRLSFAYDGRQAVDDVSFTIEAGEIFGLLGPNGAGKTTTISCLAGLKSGYDGALTFDGATFEPAKNGSDRARLGVVPQELALYEKLSARENLEFFGRLSGLEEGALSTAVDSALELSGLSERAHDRVEDYSGGMKRRLNLVIGCLHEPDLIVLDEPTVGVDPQSRNHIFDALEALRERGRTLLYTTHYMEEAERLCDRVAILDEGKVVGIGTRQQLAEASGDPSADLEKVFLTLTGKRLRDG